MKIVIMGCGRVGASLALIMAREHHDVTIIDQSSESFRRLGHEQQAKGLSIRTISGDALDEDVLTRAGLNEADAFAAVTNGDNRNIMGAQIAKYRFKVPRVICRIYDPIRQETYKQLGLESISPTIIGAQLIHDAIVSPSLEASSPAHSLAAGSSVPLPQRGDAPRDASRPGAAAGSATR